MRRLLTAFVAAVAAAPSLAATPAQERAFVDTYRKAFEAKDAATLHSLLYTKGADPKALGFYRMMTTVGMGSKIARGPIARCPASTGRCSGSRSSR